jgi:cryptochrome
VLSISSVFDFLHSVTIVVPESYARSRDSDIMAWAKSEGVKVLSLYGHTLCDPEALLAEAGGKPTTSYASFCNHLKKHLSHHPIQLAESPAELPPLSKEATSHVAQHGGSVPSLADLGYADRPSTPFRGGETEALAQMQRYLSRTQWVAEFEKPNTSPAVFQPAERSTTVLSPYLKVSFTRN